MRVGRGYAPRAIGAVVGGVALLALAVTAYAGPVPLEGPVTPPAVVGGSVLPVDDATALPEDSAASDSESDEASGSTGGPPAERGKPAWAGPPGKAGADDSQGADDTGPPPWAAAGKDLSPVICEEARNHGQYVSYVARTTQPGPDKDRIVAEAAESKCGKPARAESGS
jgi:hypothetical protein